MIQSSIPDLYLSFVGVPLDHFEVLCGLPPTSGRKFVELPPDFVPYHIKYRELFRKAWQRIKTDKDPECVRRYLYFCETHPQFVKDHCE